MNKRSEKFFKGICIYAILIFLLIFLVCPLSSVLVRAFQDKTGHFVGMQQFQDYLAGGAFWTSLKNTLHISVVSTLLSVSAAFVFAYAITRKNIVGKSWLKYVGMLPLYVPTMFLGSGLTYIFGNKGILTSLGWKLELYGSTGVIIAETLYCFPAVLSILMVAFSSADNRLYEAAEAMGTGLLRKFITITLPNVKYGLISAIFVAFTYSFTDFGAPSVLGGNMNVLATDVYKQVIGQQNFNMGAVVGMILLVPAILAFVVDRVVNQKQNATVGAKAVPYVIKKDKKSDILASIYCYLIALLIIGFFLVALFASLIKMWPYNLTLTLENYDFGKAMAQQDTNVVLNSMLVGVITAVIGTILTFLSAYLIEKNKDFAILRRVTYFLSIMPLAIPGTVIGLGYILFFNQSIIGIPFTEYSLVNPLHGIYGTLWILVFVNIIHYYSVPFTTATTALKKLDKEFESVSAAMGVPFFKTLRRVTIPLCFGAISEMIVYYFVNSMVTISAVVFLYSPKFPIASVSIVNMEGAGNMEAAIAMGMTILYVNIIVRFLYETIMKIRMKTLARSGGSFQ